MALEQRPILTLDLAKKMAAGCEEKARKGGSKMNIAILDIGGNEKYFLRQDDAFLKSGQIAHMKASTSAGLPFSTKQVGQFVPSLPGIAFIPGVVTFEGGVPIMLPTASRSTPSAFQVAPRSRTGSAPKLESTG